MVPIVKTLPSYIKDCQRALEIFRDFNLIFRLSPKQSCGKKNAVVFGARATTAQLYCGRDTFEFEQGHVTKNPPIAVLVLLRESLGI